VEAVAAAGHDAAFNHDPDVDSGGPSVTARDEILARVRTALRDVPKDESPDAFPVPRDYLSAHTGNDPAALVDLLAENLADYRAHVHRCSGPDLPATIADLLRRHGSAGVVAPAGLPAGWLAAVPENVNRITDSADLTARDLDAADTVVTGAAIAIAESGTIVLDAGPAQGRRALTLVPDHHICVLRVPEQVVASVPQAIALLHPARLGPGRPQTWIAGPSATSDIEFNRVEGVHGPRTLDVILVQAPPAPE
jgi:L-lactate dehydrogenase complex protein LldG